MPNITLCFNFEFRAFNTFGKEQTYIFSQPSLHLKAEGNVVSKINCMVCEYP